MTAGGPAFSADVVHQDGSVVLALTGELDVASASELRRSVAEVVSPHLHRVTLDLRALTFVDVVGLRAIVDVQQMAEAAGADLTLSGVSERTLEVIRLARFEELEPLTSF